MVSRGVPAAVRCQHSGDLPLLGAGGLGVSGEGWGPGRRAGSPPRKWVKSGSEGVNLCVEAA